MSGRPWTPEDITRLVDGWCEDNLSTIARNLGRTQAAVTQKAYYLGLGNARSRYLSLAQVIERTGYGRLAILNVAARLGLKLARAPRTAIPKRGIHRGARWYGIELEQLEAIKGELRRIGVGRAMILRSPGGEWGGPKPAVCRRCGTTDRPHQSRGLCKRCLRVVRYHGELELYPPVRRRGQVKEEKDGSEDGNCVDRCDLEPRVGLHPGQPRV